MDLGEFVLVLPQKCCERLTDWWASQSFDPSCLFGLSIIQDYLFQLLYRFRHRLLFLYTHCKVDFNQPSCWFYSVPNLLVFQQLVTLYLGGFVVRVVSEIEC